ncbi:HAD hydrolase-like protein [Zafaria sp. Z1313]|uniref:HAD hydrolase-like protein n=1 Tax=unclassified Zafaria TaxID=2828765 RepID=UPI002E795E7D|nr:HAD hydrolase-like protein [Zafaria sp. J156]MEE1620192.1 HAD hydrolase-like protein [Zafaria sp. J156]
MIPARAVLFDLDGTLVDPAGAITGGILHALRRNGIADPGRERLDAMVGPPLAESLLALPGMTDALLPEVIADYRAEYAARGMAASRVYPGLRGLLSRLRAEGTALAVATSKPEPIALRLLEVQGLLDAVDSVHGTDLEETSHAGHGKAPLVAAALQTLGADPAHAVMVGDRSFDVEGAHANGIPCIGVSWGFALDGELAEAGADAVADDTDGLAGLLADLGPWAGAGSAPGSATGTDGGAS